jgi:hypothetical protein
MKFSGVILGANGVPQSNPNYLFDAYEVLPVIKGQKKICVTNFDKDWVYKGYPSNETFPDPEIIYTYDDIKQLAKGIDLVKCRDEGRSIFFLRENMKYAYASYAITHGLARSPKIDTDFDKSELNDIYHTVHGILLSYDKEDICAWLSCCGLSKSEFLSEYKHLSDDEISKNQEFIERYRKHREWFEHIWEDANKLIKLYTDDEVPSWWTCKIENVFQYE